MHGVGLTMIACANLGHLLIAADGVMDVLVPAMGCSVKPDAGVLQHAVPCCLAGTLLL
jgi:hypothetical protein